MGNEENGLTPRSTAPSAAAAGEIRPLREIEYRLRAEASFLFREPMYAETMREAADVIEAAKRAFATLTRAIEREGYEVLHDLTDNSFSVRRKQSESDI